LVTQLYGLSVTPRAEELIEIAEPWRPLRTWAAVLIRAAAGRLGKGCTTVVGEA
jgi:DNA-3-methyladenine glycosylase II